MNDGNLQTFFQIVGISRHRYQVRLTHFPVKITKKLYIFSRLQSELC